MKNFYLSFILKSLLARRFKRNSLYRNRSINPPAETSDRILLALDSIYVICNLRNFPRASRGSPFHLIKESRRIGSRTGPSKRGGSERTRERKRERQSLIKPSHIRRRDRFSDNRGKDPREHSSTLIHRDNALSFGVVWNAWTTSSLEKFPPLWTVMEFFELVNTATIFSHLLLLFCCRWSCNSNYRIFKGGGLKRVNLGLIHRRHDSNH